MIQEDWSRSKITIFKKELWVMSRSTNQRGKSRGDAVGKESVAGGGEGYGEWRGKR